MPTLSEAVKEMDDEVKVSCEMLNLHDDDNCDFSGDLEKAWQKLRKEIAHTHAVLIDLLMRGEVLRSVCMTPDDKPDRDRDLWDAAAAKARKLLGVE